MIKKLVFLVSGIILIVLGGYLSTVPYNAAPVFATVHEFSYGCIIQSPEFMETYDSAHERGTCMENYMLFVILVAIIISGIVLIFKSKNFKR